MERSVMSVADIPEGLWGENSASGEPPRLVVMLPGPRCP